MDDSRQKTPDKPRPPKRHFLSYKRRWVIWGTLLLIIGGMVTYNTLTQDHRVRAFLQRELSEIVGGPVFIEDASFSIFDGLRVRNATISVDSAGRDDSELIKAERLNIALDYSRLLQFRIDFKSVEAEGVRIELCEDPATDTWNFQRLLDKSRLDELRDQPRIQPTAPTRVPGIFINDAVVHYRQRVNAKLQSVGDISITATIFPMASHGYGFNVVTDPSSGKDVHLVGWLDRETNIVTGQISELNIDHSLRELLPSRVRKWFKEYDFTGRFSVPTFRYRFANAAAAEAFELTLAYKDARLTVQPRHWLTPQELWRMALVRETISTLKLMGLNQPIAHDKLLTDSDADVVPLDLISYLQVETRPIPLYLTEVNGQTIFTDHAVSMKQECKLQGQQLEVSGDLQGYSADAAGVVSIRTKPGTYIQIPPSQQFMAWVPDDVRKAYLQFKPRGKGMIGIQLTREVVGGPFDPVVVVNLFDSQMEFDDFPYPLQKCEGSFIFSHDSQRDQDLLRIQDLHGVGLPDGPNAKSVVTINGTIGPFIKGGPGFDVRVSGRDISSEPGLRQSFPKEVAQAMDLFGPPDYGHRLAAAGVKKMVLSPEESMEWPHFAGDFDAHVFREPGPRKSVTTDVELRLKKATGTLKLFPYPMEELSCLVKIRDSFLELHDLQMKRNGATLKLDGKVSFSDPINPDIRVDARNVPLDDDLLDALPATERSWIKRAGLDGKVDIAGRIFLKELAVNADKAGKDDSEVDFDLNIRAHDAKLLKDANGPAITNLNGDLTLHPARIDFVDLTGRRGEGTLSTSGSIDWNDGTPDVQLKLNAQALLLDNALRDILPPAVQESWKQHRPEGTTDLDLDYQSVTPPETADASAPTTEPTESIKLTLRPRKMSAMTDVFPYRLDDLHGEITVDDKHVRLINLEGHHGETTLKVNADGVTGPEMDFKLSVLATKVTPQKDLNDALPQALVEVLDGIAAKGIYDIRFDTLRVRDAVAGANRPRVALANPTTTSRSASTQPVDVDFNCVVTTTGSGNVDLGFPVTDIFGWVQLIGEVREDRLTKLSGVIGADSYKILGRSGSNLTANLRKPDYSDGMLLQSIRTQLAGGSVAGDVTIVAHGDAPSQYAVEAVVQNANLAEVIGPTTKTPLQGNFSASFDVEGVFGDTRNRRGRGNVQIRGHDMYEAPIILGFFRLVNFALPVRAGVNDIDVSYTLMGDQAIFDSIQFSAPGLRIYGDGVVDFARREVDMTLNTENPDAWTLPLLHQLVRKAREELLQIRIKGSLEEPKVQAHALPTFQATLDQVVQDVKNGRR